MTEPYLILSYSLKSGSGIFFAALGEGLVIVKFSCSLPDLMLKLFPPVFSCTTYANPPEECTGTFCPLIVSFFFGSDEPIKKSNLH